MRTGQPHKKKDKKNEAQLQANQTLNDKLKTKISF